MSRLKCFKLFSTFGFFTVGLSKSWALLDLGQRERWFTFVRFNFKIFSSDFICNFEMNAYPFDVQVCHLNFTLTGKQLSTNRYIFINFKMNPTATRSQHLKFFLIGWCPELWYLRVQHQCHNT
jgi:hypothetical protein